MSYWQSPFYLEAAQIARDHGVNNFGDLWGSGQWNPRTKYGVGEPEMRWLSDRLAEWQDNGDGFLGGLGNLGDIGNLALGTAGFGVGGVSGANAATGGGVTPQTLALDASGLAAGYGLAGMGLGAGSAAAGGGEAATSALQADLLGTGATYSSTVPGTEAAFTVGNSAPYSAANWGAVEAAGLGGAGSAGAAGGLYSAPSPASSPAPTTAASTTAKGGLASFLANPLVLGTAGGVLLGSGILGGGGEAGKTTTEEGLPDWLIPYARPALDRYTNELQSYQTDPQGIMPSAMKEFKNTISGMYLDPSTNKYLEDYFRLGSERIKGALSPSFGHMQAFGQHSGYNEALSRGLGDFATGLYGGNYSKERDRQNQMTASAPSFLGQSSTAQFAPYQQYLNTVGNLGKKKEQPYFDNPMGNILGGGMLGWGLGQMFQPKKKD